ncbi:MAG: light-harvesting protein [Alphaproteobacteria bacterium]|jgi:hypothetical protein|nr:light-harvesting protein [Alphaproteobacteria bacterium]
MHKIWMVVNPMRVGVAGTLGVVTIAAVIHFAVLSSPRYCDHLGWCAASTATANTALPRR